MVTFDASFTAEQLHEIWTALVLTQADISLIELVRIYELRALEEEEKRK